MATAASSSGDEPAKKRGRHSAQKKSRPQTDVFCALNYTLEITISEREAAEKALADHDVEDQTDDSLSQLYSATHKLQRQEEELSQTIPKQLEKYQWLKNVS